MYLLYIYLGKKSTQQKLPFSHTTHLHALMVVVRCGKGVMYLTSLGRPTDIGYSRARHAILLVGKGSVCVCVCGGGGGGVFLLFLHFHSCSLSSLSLSFISSTISSIFFLPFSGR